METTTEVHLILGEARQLKSWDQILLNRLILERSNICSAKLLAFSRNLNRRLHLIDDLLTTRGLLIFKFRLPLNALNPFLAPTPTNEAALVC